MIKRLFLAALLAFGINGHKAHATNDYFDSADYTALTDHTLARASALNSIFAAIEVGFDRVQTGSAEFFNATSTTVVEIATGSKSFTIETGKAFVEGTMLLITSDADNANYMFGTVTAYSGTSLTVDVEVIGGSGTLNDWVISMTGLRGLTGATGAGTGDLLAANNLSDVSSAATARTNLGVPALTGDTFTGNTGIVSTDAGATEAPIFTLDRDSASPFASDRGGQINLTGEDSAGNDQVYGFISTTIIDPTSTSEDGDVTIGAPIAGSSTTTLTVGNGVKVGNPTGGHCGAGCLNADTDVKIDNVSIVHGVAQVVSDTEVTYTTLGTILPVDNTIPQITEGNEVLSVAITPKNASSTIRITFTGFVGGSTNQTFACALFVDATANALDATAAFVPNIAAILVTQLVLQHEVSAGSTSSRTYRIRCGSNIATDAFLNGDVTGRLFGGVASSTLKVEEVLPQ
jgi:hypothetical protein